VLDHLGTPPGEKVSADKLPEGRIKIRALRPDGQIAGIFDLLREEDGPFLSIEEIRQVSTQGCAGKR
jgi:hypothetical protein